MKKYFKKIIDWYLTNFEYGDKVAFFANKKFEKVVCITKDTVYTYISMLEEPLEGFLSTLDPSVANAIRNSIKEKS